MSAGRLLAALETEIRSTLRNQSVFLQIAEGRRWNQTAGRSCPASDRCRGRPETRRFSLFASVAKRHRFRQTFRPLPIFIAAENSHYEGHCTDSLHQCARALQGRGQPLSPSSERKHTASPRGADPQGILNLALSGLLESSRLSSFSPISLRRCMSLRYFHLVHLLDSTSPTARERFAGCSSSTSGGPCALAARRR